MTQIIEKRLRTLEERTNPPKMIVLFQGVDDPPEDKDVIVVWMDRGMMSTQDYDKRGLPHDAFEAEFADRDEKAREKLVHPLSML